jgi:hypothetical protein
VPRITHLAEEDERIKSMDLLLEQVKILAGVRVGRVEVEDGSRIEGCGCVKLRKNVG